MSSEMGRSLSIHHGQLSIGFYVGGVISLSGVLGVFQGLFQNAGAERLGIGLVALPVGAGILAFAYNRWKQVLEIFEGGFTWSRPFGKRTVARTEVGGAAIESTTSTNMKTWNRATIVELKIALTNGRTLSITGIERIQDAASLIGGLAPSAPPPPRT